MGGEYLDKFNTKLGVRLAKQFKKYIGKFVGVPRAG